MENCCLRVQALLERIYHSLWLEPGQSVRSPYGMSFGSEEDEIGYSERSKLLGQAQDGESSRKSSRTSTRSSTRNGSNHPPKTRPRRRTLEARHTMSFIPSDDDLQLPLEFRRKYELGGMVGVGTSSKCYLTTRRNDGKEFACKVIDTRKLSMTHPEGIVDQFKSEIDTLKILNHPNIISLEDHYDTEDKILIVMELLRGGELFDKIVAENGLDEYEARTIFSSVCDAIRYMHSEDVIHRDVKPENMLLVSNKSSDVKIIDFGFSKVMNGGAYARSFMGTGGFLAPELRYSNAYTKAVDMWSLGVTLYVMLSGYLPFDAGIDPKPESQFKLRFPSRQWDHISASAKDLVIQLLQVNPDRRFSADQVMNHPWVRKPMYSPAMGPTDLMSSPVFDTSESKVSRGLSKPVTTYASSDEEAPDSSPTKHLYTSSDNDTNTDDVSSVVDVFPEKKPREPPSSPTRGSPRLSPSNSESTSTTYITSVAGTPPQLVRNLPKRQGKSPQSPDMGAGTPPCLSPTRPGTSGSYTRTSSMESDALERLDSLAHIPTPYLGPSRLQTGMLLSRDKAQLKRSCSLPNIPLMRESSPTSVQVSQAEEKVLSKSVHGGNLFLLYLQQEQEKERNSSANSSNLKKNSTGTARRIPELVL